MTDTGPAECLRTLVRDIEEAFGQRYKDIVAEASGDISVNTAFKAALREERQQLADLYTALSKLRDQWRAKYDAPNGHPETFAWEAFKACAADLEALLP